MEQVVEFVDKAPREWKGLWWALVFLLVIPLTFVSSISTALTILTYQAFIVYCNYKLDNQFYKDFKYLWRKIKKHL